MDVLPKDILRASFLHSRYPNLCHKIPFAFSQETYTLQNQCKFLVITDLSKLLHKSQNQLFSHHLKNSSIYYEVLYHDG